MSHPASQDGFVPFEPVSSPAPKTAGAPPGLKVLPKAEAGTTFSPLPAFASGHAHANSMGKPVVTLQCEGDRVTSIRIECVCGQIIELACSY